MRPSAVSWSQSVEIVRAVARARICPVRASPNVSSIRAKCGRTGGVALVELHFAGMYVQVRRMGRWKERQHVGQDICGESCQQGR
jgi:hypothetical protein